MDGAAEEVLISPLFPQNKKNGNPQDESPLRESNPEDFCIRDSLP
jgi:hypothetical protein